MEKYQIGEKLGEGTYGKVYKLKRTNTQVVPNEVKLYAAKFLLPTQSADGIPGTSIREISIMRALPSHINIIKLEEIFSYKDSLVLVLEYAKTDLSKFLEDKVHKPLNQIKWVFFQMMAGLAHLHKNGIIHRDIKPANILLDVTGVPKLCDFGLSRSFHTPTRQLSSTAITLLYRPPEMLWGSLHYSMAADIWSMGCVLLEMLFNTPLFPVKNATTEAMRKDIFKIRGTPTPQTWPNFYRLPAAVKQPPNYELQAMDMKDILRSKGRTDAADDAQLIDLIERLLQLNPDTRVDAAAALHHPWFNDIPAEIRLKCAV